MNVTPSLLPLKRAAATAGVSRRVLRDLIARGYLRAYRRGGGEARPRAGVYLADVVAAIARGAVLGPPPAANDVPQRRRGAWRRRRGEVPQWAAKI